MSKVSINLTKVNSLNTKGLSLSQAQSISNLINQEATQISKLIDSINNASKTIKVEGVKHTMTQAFRVPENIVELLKRKGKLHACQAFLMENIKAKDELLRKAKDLHADISGVEIPSRPEFVTPKLIDDVTEEFGWSELSIDEINEYYDVDAQAAHIGKFIHKDGKLTQLRDELNKIPTIEFFELEKGKKTPVSIVKHNTSEGLMKIHTDLAILHRDSEKRVNYFKAKVKNIVTLENARIANLNANELSRVNGLNDKLRIDYQTKHDKAQADIKEIKQKFEAERNLKIKEISTLRILVPDRFKEIVDEFMVDVE